MMVHLANFTLTGVLHEGLETLIYEGYRDTDRLPIVAKLPKAQYPSVRELARLRNEYAILRSLDSPNIVKAHALETYGNGLALILDRIPASPLSQRLRSGRLSIRSALRVARSLATILAYVHEHELIHKDIKPQNILIEEGTDQVFLIDFGIATRLPQETQVLAAPDSLEGTLAYISPEQTGRMNRSIGHRTDFYSFGVTLYEMLTGKLPFRSSDPSELVHLHIAQIAAAPETLNPEIPAGLSALVMKLLAKDAEDRYQRARGLIADLEECLSAWESTGTIPPFALGRKDINPQLQFPQKLIGRETQVATLIAAFTRAQGGSAELLLVTGPPGIGKSALVGEVHPVLARHNGSFIAGKFDQLNRSVPFSGFVQAFHEQVRQILSQSEERLAVWKAALSSALGANARLLTDLVPDLDLVLGPQPPVAELGPTEAQNRFGLVLQNFVRALCSPVHPLVLYLDDLQWADTGSFWLLQTLLADPARGHLLIIASYRSQEVDAAHPLAVTLDALRQQGITPQELTLGPLDFAGVRRLLGETLGQEASPQLDSLATLVLAKTYGNPFFLLQFLTTLKSRGLLRIDPDLGRWVWDHQRISEAPLTDNVVDFIAEQIQKLDEETQRALAVAACVGYQFDLTTLAATLEEAPSRTATVLWPALRAGLLVPVSMDYRLLSGHEEVDSKGPQQADSLRISYRFIHDRTRQAAFERLTPEQRAQTQYRIGRRLREHLPAEPRAEVLFEVINHLNAGISAMTDPVERQDAARLNQRAGRLARGATAYSASAAFLSAAVSLFGEGGWTADPGLAYSLHRDLAEYQYLSGDFAQADAQLGELLNRVGSDAQRADLLGLRMMLYTSLGRFEEAMAAGLAGLALLNVVLPTTPLECQHAFMGEVLAIEQLLAARPESAPVDSARLTDPEKVAVLQLMLALSQPAYQIAPPLAALVIAKQVSYSLTYGNAGISPYGYAAYGLILAGLLGRYQEAVRFGSMALSLVESKDFSEVACKVRFMYAIYAPYKLPLRASLPEFAQAQQTGLETGDLFYGSLAFSYFPLTQLRVGDHLDSVRREISRGLAAMKRTKDHINTAALTMIMQVTAALADRTESPTSLSGEGFSEAEWLTRIDAMRFGAGRCLIHMYKLRLAYLHGDYASALAMAEGAEQTLATSLGMHWTTDIPFYAGLAAAAALAEGGGQKTEQLQALLARHCEMVAGLAAACPENMQHRHLLLAAERARAAGERAQALDLFDRAVESARQSGLIHEEALANELCGSYYLGLGRTKIAALYLAEARHGYERWGATAKVRQLSGKYGALLAEGSNRPALKVVVPDLSETTSTVWMTGRRLDMDSALKAAQAISSEIVLDKALARVMKVVLSIAGAQRGFLVLERDGSLWVEAVMTVNPEREEVGIHSPLAERTDLAVSVVRYVSRSHELVLLGNAIKDLRFASDPYISTQRPKSILCMALLNHSRLSGVLYLEHNGSLDAFTSDRVELLRILSSQAATSVENGLLYSNLQEATERLRQANDTLEQQVTQRTAQLTKALQELWSEMDLARKIQTVLLPTELNVPGYEIAATMRPADNVGGDYYDTFRAAGTDWLLIGDVSGHGISAGLCMMMAQTSVRSVVRTLQRTPTTLRPSEVLALVNSAIHRNLAQIGRDQYMTITAFCFRDDVITYAGQHQDILIYRAATRRIEQIETRGVWLGVLPSIDDLLPEDQIRLEPGDIMLLFTDGITEAKVSKRKMLLTKGLVQLFEEAVKSSGSVEGIITQLVEKTSPFAIDDDLTLIAVKRQRMEPPRMTLKTLSLEIPVAWNFVKSVKRMVEEALKDYSDSLRYSAGMVASELVGNAIKYGDRTESAPQARVLLTVTDKQVVIEVCNGVGSPEHLAQVTRRIDQLSGTKNKEEYYLGRLQELLSGTSQGSQQGSQLGIYRIGYEGDFDLSYTYKNHVLTIKATRGLS